MIRLLIAIMTFSTFGSAAMALPCNTDLKLTCTVNYSYDGMRIQTAAETSVFTEENTYEPSTAQCTSTIYFYTDTTVLRASAATEQNSGSALVQAIAVSRGAYSNGLSSVKAIGQNNDLGTLKLALPVSLEQGLATEATVSCIVK